jgi:two-component system, OmpR family, phosphate regulon sensor histidine kinase PhoR
MSEILELIDLPALLIERGLVSFANPAALQLLGGHIVGQDLRLAIRHPAALALLASGKNGRIRINGLSVRGSIWELACHSLEDETQLITLHDLSVQISTARAHADFVANASHELRTPLAAILGYVETLSDPKAGDDLATRTRFLGIIGREARRMQALIEDLMSLSRIEAVKHDAPQDKIDLVALTQQAIGEVQGREGLTLETNASSVIVAGDRGQLAQVLRNLIDNALKYGDPDGQVAVAVEMAESGWVQVTIHNTGSSIPPEHLPRLTERFYRIDASRSREAGGTGLGLSIVKHIVERHRGRFDISSRPGEGTTASIMLPLHSSG